MAARLASRMRGISLIEALVALAVVGIGMIGIVGMQASLRGNADIAKQRSNGRAPAADRSRAMAGICEIGSRCQPDFVDYTDLAWASPPTPSWQ